MTTVQTQIPDQLLQQAQYLVQQGWIANIDDLIAESMRRYLESHRESMTERFIREDVDWGLRGQDWTGRRCWCRAGYSFGWIGLPVFIGRLRESDYSGNGVDGSAAAQAFGIGNCRELVGSPIAKTIFTSRQCFDSSL